MTFTVQSMLGNQALVSGTDSLGNTGKTVVDTSQWDELIARDNYSAAVEDFESAVAEFFAPLTEAAEAAAEASVPQSDPMEYVVLKEGVDHVAGQPDEVVALTRDSIILRLISEEQTDRLIWVDGFTLGILAVV